MHEDAVEDRLDHLFASMRGKKVVLLTGAGISAESGIPTFRGKEGYWTVGAREYHPQELATMAAFRAMPREVWRWYLYRRGVCRQAEPNVAHRAIATLEATLGGRFTLITQNVDGLHARAGNDPLRNCEVHGNIDFMRPIEGGKERYPIPEHLTCHSKDDPLSDADFEALRCPDGRPARPHVLWFDEFYDEALYRSNTAVAAAGQCRMLIVVGSSGATSLPMHAMAEAARARARVIDINPEDNPFATFARGYERGLSIRGSACEWVPRLAERLLA